MTRKNRTLITADVLLSTFLFTPLNITAKNPPNSSLSRSAPVPATTPARAEPLKKVVRSVLYLVTSFSSIPSRVNFYLSIWNCIVLFI